MRPRLAQRLGRGMCPFEDQGTAGTAAVDVLELLKDLLYLRRGCLQPRPMLPGLGAGQCADSPGRGRRVQPKLLRAWVGICKSDRRAGGREGLGHSADRRRRPSARVGIVIHIARQKQRRALVPRLICPLIRQELGQCHRHRDHAHRQFVD